MEMSKKRINQKLNCLRNAGIFVNRFFIIASDFKFVLMFIVSIFLFFDVGFVKIVYKHHNKIFI